MQRTGLISIYVFCAVYVTLFTLSPYPARAEESSSDVIARAISATVMVFSFNAETERHGQATGFFVGNKREIITNNHVVTGANQILIKTRDNKIYHVWGIVSRDVKSDLVKLAVTMPHTPQSFLPISTELPNKGDTVIVIGNPKGNKGVVSTGIITSLYQVPDFGPILHTNAAIAPGSSGSPVINSKGEVIGVASFQFGSTEKNNFAIPASKILAMKSTEVTALPGEDKNEIASADLMKQGHEALARKEYRNALSLFLLLLGTDSENTVQWREWELWFYIGRCQGGLGRHDKAVLAFTEATRLMPDHAESHYSLGVAYSFQGLLKEGREAYTEAIRLKPNFTRAHFNLALICRAQQDSACFISEVAKLNKLNAKLAGELLQ